jgi:phosphoribosylformylglycinamidine (FGAM) synthase-like enzyme
LNADISRIITANAGRLDRALFGEAASRVVLEVPQERDEQVRARLEDNEIEFIRLGETGGDELRISGLLNASVDSLKKAWSEALVVS